MVAVELLYSCSANFHQRRRSRRRRRMAGPASGTDLQALTAPSKRRRLLKPSAIVPIPVYSSRVSSSLQLKPAAALFPGDDVSDPAERTLWFPGSAQKPRLPLLDLSDSDEEPEPGQHRSEPAETPVCSAENPRCPSPPAPESPVQKPSRRATQKIREINRKLRAVSSPEPRARGSRRYQTRPSDPDDDDDDDDVIILSPDSQGAVFRSDSLHEIPLKIRFRTDVHKVLVLPSTRLGDAVGQLARTLQVPPARLLLLKEAQELPTGATVGELGLGIADIIECIVVSGEEANSSKITVKLQSRDRDSSQEFSISREAPLSSIFSRYLSSLPAGAHRKARFHFDGSKVKGSQTAAQLDLEDGDIIEVWT
ncbi:NFATC2-interacting protein [Fundulus heteroclitus]|uniref:NFATC2-interacting protein n=1 Tax=Fundulus heteroclitus TaxID=8078 RepID=UPI00165B8632|nr:NFATC2-interacting protein [Fundulus heteroclitus]